MGLDTVELVMEFEDEFGLQIPDEDASRLETVGDVYQYICNRLASVRADKCVTQHVFYRLRAGLMQTSGLPRAAIRPDRPLIDLIPSGSISKTLRRAAQARDMNSPPVFSRTQVTVTNWLAFMAICGSGFVPFLLLDYHPIVLVLCASTAIAAAIILLSILRTNVRHPRRILSIDSFGDAVRATAAMNHLNASSSEWTPEHIWLTVQKIVVEQLAVPIERVTKEASFVRDLGAN